VNLLLQPLHEVAAKVLTAGGELVDESARYEQLPEPLRRALLPFQVEGVQFGLRNGGRLLLGDEMGLGKTIQVQPPFSRCSPPFPGAGPPFQVQPPFSRCSPPFPGAAPLFQVQAPFSRCSPPFPGAAPPFQVQPPFSRCSPPFPGAGPLFQVQPPLSRCSPPFPGAAIEPLLSGPGSSMFCMARVIAAVLAA
jgi:hypothetical protein